MNEGFASYSEALWFEYAYPPYTASEYQMMYQLYLGPGTVYVEDPENENIFDSGLSYVKGSWILHMLRRVVGEDNFFDILKAYYASPKHKYGSATTEQFQAVCEQVSGINLDKFFYQWMHEEFYPHYSYSWNWTQSGSGFDINLEIRQEQTNHIFWMPIDITITTTTGETTFVVWDSLASQTFQLNVSSQPENLELDKNNWILKLIPEEIINPIFDRGILLVNGVMLDSYGDEIRNSYERRAFWGDFPITFWDCFNPSQTGYASTLPEPIGFGKIPADFLGQFSTVIWVGNDYGGDLGTWQQTSILSYLEAGGNVLLMTRNGQNYIHSDLQKYFGLIWTGSPRSRLNNCVATFSGLTDMQVTGNQTYNSVFEKEFTHNQSTLLFQETASFDEPVGLGVWCDPEEGGLYRKDGGQFVFISGRPYRYNAEHLRDNVEFILEYLMLESMAPGDGDPVKFRLEQNYPNPFKKTTTIRYYLNQPAGVTIKIYNMQGELVKSFLNREPISGGQHDVTWDGKNSNGTRVSSGVYFCRLNTSESSKVKKMLVLK
ncbi:T9SS type A sorting domain-containing protein [candidate division KSB1 bacterium]|nr:T9SS type A sorting domain-containing protein [candidate division KSB1 bacterium]